MSDHKVTYWAISVLSSRAMWLNLLAFLIALSSLTEFTTLLPPRFLPPLGCFVAVANLWLRTQTVRPVAFIMPGKTKPIEVVRIGPPPPDIMTD